MKEFQLEIIRFIQQFMSPTLNQIFELITQLGEEFLVFVVIAIVYYGYKKELGKKIMFFLLVSLTLNGTLKFLLKLPRPIGELGVQSIRVETATGYSFPSGHAQTAATLWPAIANLIKQQWFNILAGAIVILVAFSRVYLGVHYPLDALVGMFLGLGVVVGGEFLYKHYKNENYIFGITAVIFMPFAFIYLFDGDAQLAADFYKVYGLLLGVFAGIEYEMKFVKFHDTTKWLARIVRVLLAMVVILGVKEGIKLFTPDTFWMDFIRYFLVGLIPIGILPHLFKPLKI